MHAGQKHLHMRGFELAQDGAQILFGCARPPPRSRHDRQQNYAKQRLETGRHHHSIQGYMDNSPPALKLQDVSLTLKSLAGPVDILDGVSLSVAAGETIALTGP